MKKTLFVIFFSVLWLSFTPKRMQEKVIVFTPYTWSYTVAAAKVHHKLIFLDAYASWCGPCKWVAKNVFTNSEIADYYNKTFINVTIDMEKDEGLKLAKKFQVESYPTFLIINSKEEVISRLIGVDYNKEFFNTFLQFGKNAQEKWEDTTSLK